MKCYVYFIKSKINGRRAVKIGKAKDIKSRTRQLQTGSVQELELYGFLECPSDAAAYELERQLHEQFSNLRITGEWFYLSCNLKTFLNAAMEGDRRKAVRAMTKNHAQRVKGHHKCNRVVTVTTIKSY